MISIEPPKNPRKEINEFEFPSAVPGYHHYRKLCFHEKKYILDCTNETGNAFNKFPFKVFQFGKEILIDYLCKNISRMTKCVLGKGANAASKLRSVHYRISPLVQGGLEIPCRVLWCLAVLEKDGKLVEELCTEKKTKGWWDNIALMHITHVTEYLIMSKGTREDTGTSCRKQKNSIFFNPVKYTKKHKGDKLWRIILRQFQ